MVSGANQRMIASVLELLHLPLLCAGGTAKERRMRNGRCCHEAEGTHSSLVGNGEVLSHSTAI